MNWAEFFSMGGRGFYVWGSFGAFALAVIAELLLLRSRARRVQTEIKDEMLAGNVKGGVR
jgi:heme exporter protein D